MNLQLRRLVSLPLFLLVLTLAPRMALGFGLDDVARRAEQMAREPYTDHRGKVPSWMLVGSMSYDQWRDIRFTPAKSLWRDDKLPFQIQFFHPGLYYDRTIAVNTIDAGGVHPVPFSASLFNYGKNDFAERIPKDIGYAGLRIHSQIKTPEYFDEVVVFLGASYFRAVGRDNVYGLSARGIAIDTVEPTGEEFPNFIELWLVKPAAGADHIEMLALLEGPSITGAYRFVVTPGVATLIDVEARLFPRKAIRKVGIAPLTSMFFFGENSRHCFDDFRPEVHDSDGLLLHFDTGEWLWRPLDNPKRVDASGLGMHNPRGFGLVQRDREFANSQDIETRAELRPSAWVTPKGDWGDGRVELVEIPTTTELVDNIVAYWVPKEPATPGREMRFSYRVSFDSEDPTRPPAGRVAATRQDSGAKGDTNRFVIDFSGGDIEKLTDDHAPTAVITLQPEGGAKLLDHHVIRNPDTKGWRLTFQLKRSDAQPLELRAFLKSGDQVLTETWSHAIIE